MAKPRKEKDLQRVLLKSIILALQEAQGEFVKFKAEHANTVLASWHELDAAHEYSDHYIGGSKTGKILFQGIPTNITSDLDIGVRETDKATGIHHAKFHVKIAQPNAKNFTTLSLTSISELFEEIAERANFSIERQKDFITHEALGEFAADIKEKPFLDDEQKFDLIDRAMSTSDKDNDLIKNEIRIFYPIDESGKEIDAFIIGSHAKLRKGYGSSFEYVYFPMDSNSDVLDKLLIAAKALYRERFSGRDKG